MFVYLGIWALMLGGLVSIVVVGWHLLMRGPIVLKEAADALAAERKEYRLVTQIADKEAELKALNKEWEDRVKENKRS